MVKISSLIFIESEAFDERLVIGSFTNKPYQFAFQPFDVNFYFVLVRKPRFLIGLSFADSARFVATGYPGAVFR